MKAAELEVRDFVHIDVAFMTGLLVLLSILPSAFEDLTRENILHLFQFGGGSFIAFLVSLSASFYYTIMSRKPSDNGKFVIVLPCLVGIGIIAYLVISLAASATSFFANNP